MKPRRQKDTAKKILLKRKQNALDKNRKKQIRDSMNWRPLRKNARPKKLPLSLRDRMLLPPLLLMLRRKDLRKRRDATMKPPRLNVSERSRRPHARRMHLTERLRLERLQWLL